MSPPPPTAVSRQMGQHWSDQMAGVELPVAIVPGLDLGLLVSSWDSSLRAQLFSD